MEPISSMAPALARQPRDSVWTKCGSLTATGRGLGVDPDPQEAGGLAAEVLPTVTTRLTAQWIRGHVEGAILRHGRGGVPR